MNNKASITRKTLDTIFGFAIGSSYRFCCSFAMKIGSWFCPDNDKRHFFERCICKNYCYEHERDEMTGCSVCEILKINYKDHSLEYLEQLFFRVKNELYPFEVNSEEYSNNAYKYKYIS
jgi:hypothetical protein